MASETITLSSDDEDNPELKILNVKPLVDKKVTIEKSITVNCVTQGLSGTNKHSYTSKDTLNIRKMKDSSIDVINHISVSKPFLQTIDLDVNPISSASIDQNLLQSCVEVTPTVLNPSPTYSNLVQKSVVTDKTDETVLKMLELLKAPGNNGMNCFQDSPNVKELENMKDSASVITVPLSSSKILKFTDKIPKVVIKNTVNIDDNHVGIPKKKIKLSMVPPPDTQLTVNICADKTVQSDVNNVNVDKNAVDEGVHIFEKFVNKFSSMERTKTDREKGVTKLRKHFEQVNVQYRNSQEFKLLIEKCLTEMEADKHRLYYCLKEVLDTLRGKKTVSNNSCSDGPSTSAASGPCFQVEPKEGNKKSVKRLMKILMKLQVKIKELEEAEVNLDDEEDSSYFVLQRYKQRFCQVHKKLCDMTEQSSLAGSVYRKKISFNRTKFPAINKSIEKFVNKTRCFPDFQDIHKLIQTETQDLKMNLTSDQIWSIASDAFQEVGNQLQLRRRYDYWDALSSYLGDNTDPAELDDELASKLDENKAAFRQKEQELFDQYVEKERSLRCNAEPMVEDDGNKTPVESEEEEDDDEKELAEHDEYLDSRCDDIYEDVDVCEENDNADDDLLENTTEVKENEEETCEKDASHESTAAKDVDGVDVEATATAKSTGGQAAADDGEELEIIDDNEISIIECKTDSGNKLVNPHSTAISKQLKLSKKNTQLYNKLTQITNKYSDRVLNTSEIIHLDDETVPARPRNPPMYIVNYLQVRHDVNLNRVGKRKKKKKTKYKCDEDKENLDSPTKNHKRTGLLEFVDVTNRLEESVRQCLSVVECLNEDCKSKSGNLGEGSVRQCLSVVECCNEEDNSKSGSLGEGSVRQCLSVVECCNEEGNSKSGSLGEGSGNRNNGDSDDNEHSSEHNNNNSCGGSEGSGEGDGGDGDKNNKEDKTDEDDGEECEEKKDGEEEEEELNILKRELEELNNSQSQQSCHEFQCETDEEEGDDTAMDVDGEESGCGNGDQEDEGSMSGDGQLREEGDESVSRDGQLREEGEQSVSRDGQLREEGEGSMSRDGQRPEDGEQSFSRDGSPREGDESMSRDGDESMSRDGQRPEDGEQSFSRDGSLCEGDESMSKDGDESMSRDGQRPEDGEESTSGEGDETLREGNESVGRDGQRPEDGEQSFSRDGSLREGDESVSRDVQRPEDGEPNVSKKGNATHEESMSEVDSNSQSCVKEANESCMHEECNDGSKDVSCKQQKITVKKEPVSDETTVGCVKKESACGDGNEGQKVNVKKEPENTEESETEKVIVKSEPDVCNKLTENTDFATKLEPTEEVDLKVESMEFEEGGVGVEESEKTGDVEGEGGAEEKTGRDVEVEGGAEEKTGRDVEGDEGVDGKTGQDVEGKGGVEGKVTEGSRENDEPVVETESLDLTCVSDTEEETEKPSQVNGVENESSESDIEVIEQEKKEETSVRKKEVTTEETIHRLLENSPKSLTITLPKSSKYLKSPSAATVKALDTLRKLKSISTTRVPASKVKKLSDKFENNDDIVVLRERKTPRRTFTNPQPQYQQQPQQQQQPQMPVISSISGSTRTINERRIPVISSIRSLPNLQRATQQQYRPQSVRNVPYFNNRTNRNAQRYLPGTSQQVRQTQQVRRTKPVEFVVLE